MSRQSWGINVAPLVDEAQQQQLFTFEGTPVHTLKASLGSAGDLTISAPLQLGDRVDFTGSGYVSKVTFHDSKGNVKRQHVIVVDDIQIEATGEKHVADEDEE